MCSNEKEYDTTEFSDRFKRRMNRMFREQVGSQRIPHPEVDNGWERLRSRVVCMWKNRKN